MLRSDEGWLPPVNEYTSQGNGVQIEVSARPEAKNMEAKSASMRKPGNGAQGKLEPKWIRRQFLVCYCAQKTRSFGIEAFESLQDL